jgi:hypothetical protein
MTVDFSTLERNPFKLLFDLRTAFAPQKITSQNAYGYACIVGKGKFELCDYDCGLYYIYWRPVFYLKSAGFKEMRKNYVVVFTIGCAEDGAWAASTKTMPFKKCQLLVEKIKTDLIDKKVLNTMPNHRELNKLLAPFGLKGKFCP